MKFYNYCFALLALMAATVSSCKNEDIDNEHHYKNQLYVTSAPVCEDLLIKANVSEASREISYRIAAPAKQDIQINFDAAPAMTATYNLIYGDKTTALDSRFYDIPEKTTVIKAGDISSDNIVINFKNTNELDKSKRYVLPVTILSASNMDVLESKRTAYFVFKGAALINVVANIKGVYFPISWKSNVSSLPVVTVEVLMRSDDWIAGRGNALSSIFGIEGKFLVRVGDADRPRDQLQVVAPGGNFPGPNKIEGLPVNTWVHIAIVYNKNTKERIYYRDGVAVYKDEAASTALNLTNSCYIGYAWDDTRWLPADISEVRIWGIQRTAEQIANNPYEVDPASEGLISYWKFNEGAGSTITDQTDHGNDITARGNPIWVGVEIPKIN